MAQWPGVASSGGFDYVQDTAPSNPAVGEEWYDTANGEAGVWDGSQWHTMTIGEFAELGGALSVGQIPDSEITPLKLSFDPTSQTELDSAISSHSSASDAHHPSGGQAPVVNLLNAQKGGYLLDTTADTGSVNPSTSWVTIHSESVDFSGVSYIWVNADFTHHNNDLQNVDHSMRCRIAGQNAAFGGGMTSNQGSFTESISGNMDVRDLTTETVYWQFKVDSGEPDNIDNAYVSARKIQRNAVAGDIA